MATPFILRRVAVKSPAWVEWLSGAQKAASVSRVYFVNETSIKWQGMLLISRIVVLVYCLGNARNSKFTLVLPLIFNEKNLDHLINF